MINTTQDKLLHFADRCSYGKGQQDKFLEEVESAENYVGLIDWTITDELTQE